MAEAQILIIKELKDCMEVSSRFGDRHEILVDVLLEGDGFLASPDFLSVFSSDHSKSLPSMKCYLSSSCLNFRVFLVCGGLWLLDPNLRIKTYLGQNLFSLISSHVLITDMLSTTLKVKER
jgi:hypothetical protein